LGQAAPYDTEYRVICPDGSERWVSSTAKVFYTSDDKVYRMIGAMTDISERKRAEEALRRNEERLRMIIEHSHDIFFITKLAGDFSDTLVEYVTPQVLEILRYDPEELIGVGWMDLLTDNPVNQQANELSQRMFETGRSPDLFQVELWSKDRRKVWLEIDEEALIDDQGKVVGATGGARDITERRAAEQALKLTQTAVDQFTDAVFWIREDGSIGYANDEACRSLEYTREELLTLSVPDFDAEFSESGFGQAWNDLKKCRSMLFESSHRSKSGRVFPVEVRANYVEFAGEEYQFAFVRDISERKRAEEALQRSESFLSATGRTAKVGGWEVIADTGVGRFTEETYSIYEIPVGTILSVDESLEFFHPEDRPIIQQAVQRALDHGEQYDLELRFITAKGRHILVRAICEPEVVDGKTVRLAGTLQDITAHKQTERSLRAVVEGTVGAIGREFLPSLVRSLALALEVKYVFVAELTDATMSIASTLAVFADGEPAANFEYGLNGTPCAGVVGKRFCLYPDGVQELFPDDTLLVDMGVDSYFGIKLLDKSRNPMGILVAMDDKPLQNQDTAKTILTIFAAQVSAELERVHADAALSISEEKYRSLVTNIPSVTWTTDSEGRTTFISPNIQSIYGFTPDEIYAGGSNLWFGRVNPQDRKDVEAAFLALIKHGTPFDVEYQIRRKDGELIWLYDSATRTYDDHGVIRADGVLTDITARKHAEEALTQSEELLSQIINATPNSVFVKDRAGRYIMVNKAMAERHGETPEALVGRTDLEVARHWLDTPKKVKLLRAAERNVIDRKVTLSIPEEEFTFNDGTTGWFQTTKIPIAVHDNPDCLVGVAVDITARKRFEQELKQLYEKLQQEQKALEEKNIALRQVLDHMEDEKEGYKHEICDSVEKLIMPVVSKLDEEDGRLGKRDVAVLKDALNAIVEKDLDVFAANMGKLSSRELDICALIKKGCSSKQIADELNISVMTVHKHRDTIRKKLQLSNRSVNLAAYLRSR
jgi:PAS domain S-box-containing protein